MTIATIDTVSEIRRFNRFYTQKIGVLSDNVYHRPLSLTEARVLYEVANGKDVTASQLAAALALNPGYLSRTLRGLAKRGLLKRTKPDDRRKNILTLTRKGTAEFARINAASSREMTAMIRSLSPAQQRRMVTAMQAIESLLEPRSAIREPFVLRSPGPGDYGWVMERHGAIYAAEYGWNEEFEALVGEIVVNFVRKFDPRRERAWIAERDGQNAGCVFLVRKSERVSQLRLLLVEPGARGSGIGRRLVEECIRFAKQCGYTRMILWTNDVLDAARHIYERCGFRMTGENRHHSFGHDLVGQTWEVKL
ncbi:MAG TPA: helix-turn-helix domain-containing GNAT family N-acetyltransferase [Thermoanaerobaculia bacterium]|nr:helix-turn-helix domain-containing GNAT family N-acetyltransferase [Thermoanaerobaculia bacterium]